MTIRALANGRQRHGAVIVGPGAKLRFLGAAAACAGAAIDIGCRHSEPP